MRRWLLPVLLVASVLAAFYVNQRWPGHNPPLRPDCSDYWTNAYTAECGH